MVFGDPASRFTPFEDSVLGWGPEQSFRTWAGLAERWPRILWPLVLPARTGGQLRRRAWLLKKRAQRLARRYATVLAEAMVVVQWSSDDMPDAEPPNHSLEERQAAVRARHEELLQVEADEAAAGVGCPSNNCDDEEASSDEGEEAATEVCPICLEVLTDLDIVTLDCPAGSDTKHEVCVVCFRSWIKARRDAWDDEQGERWGDRAVIRCPTCRTAQSPALVAAAMPSLFGAEQAVLPSPQRVHQLVERLVGERKLPFGWQWSESGRWRGLDDIASGVIQALQLYPDVRTLLHAGITAVPRARGACHQAIFAIDALGIGTHMTTALYVKCVAERSVPSSWLGGGALQCGKRQRGRG